MNTCIVIISSLVAVATALYSPSDDVIELTASNFNQKVIQSDDLWLIEFYAPWCGHCKQLAPEWKKAASALKGIVKVGGVDMDQHQSVGAPYGIKGFPTIKIFGGDKNKPSDYNAQRTAQSFVDTAMSQLKSLVNSRLSGGGSKKSGGGGGGGGSKKSDPADVIELTDSNFEDLVLNSEDMWMVEFFAPWCGHCKSLAPHWEQAATELKGKVKVGALDATVHTVMAGRYGVRGFPTIKMFPQGKSAKSEAVDFEAGRTSSDIVNWALDKLSENVPPPEVYQITDEKVLKENCEGHQLCIIAILPHILDCQSECRNSYIKLLKNKGDVHKKKGWGYLWAEAMAQPHVEQALGIGGFGYPAMAAVNLNKKVFVLLKGSFSETGIHEFLRDLSYGRGSPIPIKELPKVDSSAPWDGKDGELPQEEDWDLSDVELDDLPTDQKVEL